MIIPKFAIEFTSGKNNAESEIHNAEFSLKPYWEVFMRCFRRPDTATATDVIIREYDDFHSNYNQHAYSPPFYYVFDNNGTGKN